MTKKLLYNSVIFIIVILLLHIYEYSAMMILSGETGISSIAVLLLLVVSAIYSLNYITKFNDKFTIIFLSFCATVYLASLLNVSDSPFPNRITYIVLLLPFFIYIFIYKITIRTNDKILLVPVFMTILFYSISIRYFLNYSSLSSGLIDEDNYGMVSTYALLYFMPFILCLKNKYIVYITLFVIFVAVLLSFKRMGIIAFCAGFFAYYFVNNEIIQRKHQLFRIILFLLISVFLLIVYNYIDNLSGDFLSYRFNEIQSDDGSGRIPIYKNVVEMISLSEFPNLLFGHGWNAVSLNGNNGLSAHNDFLEIIYDFGIIAFILYLFIYFFLYKKLKKLIKASSQYAGPFAASCVIFILASNVSHIVIYMHFFILYVIFWGFVSAKEKIDL